MTDLDAYHIKLIKKGLRAAEEGKFVSHAEMKKLIAGMGRKKKGSNRNVRKSVAATLRRHLHKALKILPRAGKKNPPVPGDELP